MRGIQINNYFNNHITLNGKKVVNDQQGIVPIARPKPLIIQHNMNSNQPIEGIEYFIQEYFHKPNHQP
jgi:hypothetical protein